jgi:hypothetical protein
MGQPGAFFTVNGKKRQSQAPVRRPDDARTSAQQFWTEFWNGFWTERLEALKRHLDRAPATNSDTGGPDAEEDG